MTSPTSKEQTKGGHSIVFCLNVYIVIFVSFFNPLAYIHTGPFFCSNMGEGLRTMKSQDGIEKIIVFDCCKLVTAQETNKLDKEISSASYILCYCCWLLAISNLTSNSFFFFFHSSEMWRLRSTKCFSKMFRDLYTCMYQKTHEVVYIQLGKCNVAWGTFLGA